MELPKRRIAVLGAGAIGCLYGALLARQGDSVALITRSSAEAIRGAGLSFSGAQGGFAWPDAEAHENSSEVGPVDWILVAQKATANESLGHQIQPLLKPGTVLVTLQNGLGNEEQLLAVAEGRQVLGMVCFVAASRRGPGVVEVYHRGSVAIGHAWGPLCTEVEELAERFRRAGIPAKTGHSLRELRWRKLIWNIPFNGLSIAAGGIDTARILADPRLACEVRSLMDEVAAVAAAEGCCIPESFLQSQIDVTPGLGAYRPSSLIDFQAGRAVELNAIWAEPVRRAHSKGVPVPRMELLLAILSRLLADRSPT
jgi:2-dehydropantoate 2-reductase